MKRATISQTKNQLSALIDLVKHGETVLIVDRDRPVARLEPVVVPEATEADGRLQRLERAGLLRRGKGGVEGEILKRAPPRPRAGGDILRALLDEREDSR